MNVDRLLAALREALPAAGMESREVPVDETLVALPAGFIRPAVDLLVNRFGVCHLSAITGDDTGEAVVLLYHFWQGQGLTLRTELPPHALHVSSVSDLVPGATLYEREVNEMLGVVFEGHPGLEALLLPDDWDGPPPLRKAGAGGAR